MKTMWTPSYHHNGFVATHAFGHMMYIHMRFYIYYIYIPLQTYQWIFQKVILERHVSLIWKRSTKLLWNILISTNGNTHAV